MGGARIEDWQWSEFERSFGPLSEGARLRGLLADYLCLLREANEKVNLTSITDWNDGVWKHLYDSLLVTRGRPTGVVLDWGTGGGAPGIPLAIWGSCEQSSIERVVLLDSVGKKVRAVDSFLEPLGLREFADAVNARGEAYIKEHAVDTVVMRAVAPPERIIPWVSSRRVKKWIFMVGPQSLSLWASATPVFKKRGLHLSEQINEELPGALGMRHVLVFLAK